MDLAEAAILQAKIVAYDSRNTSSLTDAAWAEALDDVTLPDALEAVRAHYRTQTRWIMPADVRTAVKAMRRDRLDRAGHPDLPDDLDRDQELAYARRWRALVGSGVPADEATARVDREMRVQRAELKPRPVEQLSVGRSA